MNYVVIGFELAIGVVLACLAVWAIFVFILAMLERVADRRDASRRRAALPNNHPDYEPYGSPAGRKISGFLGIVGLLAIIGGAEAAGNNLDSRWFFTIAFGAWFLGLLIGHLSRERAA
jgi:hypothetical protein